MCIKRPADTTSVTVISKTAVPVITTRCIADAGSLWDVRKETGGRIFGCRNGMLAVEFDEAVGIRRQR